MRIKNIVYIAGLLVLIIFKTNAQEKHKCHNDTTLIVGKHEVCESMLELTKKQFLSPGKLRVNQNGFTVNQFTYSMFTLGKKTRVTVYDSMFPEQMKKEVMNTNINYRYINLEGIKMNAPDGSLFVPAIDTLKIKFIYP